MGYMVELNTLLGLPSDFKTDSLQLDKTFKITKDKERAFPLHIAVLVVDSEWNFYGYAVVNSANIKESKTEFEFKMLSLFSDEVKEVYKNNFISAAKSTGEIK